MLVPEPSSCSLFFHHTDVFILRWWAAGSFCCRCINKVLIAVMFLLIDFLSDENVRRRRGSVVSLHYNHQGPAAQAAAARVNTWRGRDGRQTSPGSISARKLYFDKCYRSEKHVNTCKCQQFTPIWRLLIKRCWLLIFTHSGEFDDSTNAWFNTTWKQPPLHESPNWNNAPTGRLAARWMRGDTSIMGEKTSGLWGKMCTVEKQSEASSTGQNTTHTWKPHEIVITKFSTVSRSQQNFVARCWQPTRYQYSEEVNYWLT